MSLQLKQNRKRKRQEIESVISHEQDVRPFQLAQYFALNQKIVQLPSSLWTIISLYGGIQLKRSHFMDLILLNNSGEFDWSCRHGLLSDLEMSVKEKQELVEVACIRGNGSMFRQVCAVTNFCFENCKAVRNEDDFVWLAAHFGHVEIIEILNREFRYPSAFVIYANYATLKTAISQGHSQAVIAIIQEFQLTKQDILKILSSVFQYGRLSLLIYLIEKFKLTLQEDLLHAGCYNEHYKTNLKSVSGKQTVNYLAAYFQTSIEDICRTIYKFDYEFDE